jgi:WD40 repeat protein
MNVNGTNGCLQVSACSWSPDGSKVMSFSEDKTVRVWDVSQGACIATLSGHEGSVSDYQLAFVAWLN